MRHCRWFKKAAAFFELRDYTPLQLDYLPGIVYNVFTNI